MRRRLLRQVPVNLVSVWKEKAAAGILYKLLQERTPEVNISHGTMPTEDEHLQFVLSHPYTGWYLIEADDAIGYVGSVYLSKQNEIGVFIFQAHQGKGYGAAAIQALMDKHPRGRYLANVNPQNKRSIKMFKRLGFNLLQHTYELK